MLVDSTIRTRTSRPPFGSPGSAAEGSNATLRKGDTVRRIALRTALLASVMAVAAAGTAAANADRVVGHVYVNDNTAPVNTIAAPTER
jgi:hypothetical protein